MKIKNVEIKNYKSIRHLTLVIDDLTAIVGKNNYGKSAILDAIQCFYGEKNIDVDDFHLATDQDILIKITFYELTDNDIERFFDYPSMKYKTLTKIKERGSDEEFKIKQFRKLEETKNNKFKETIDKLHLNYPSTSEFTITFSKPKSKGNGVFKINDDYSITKAEVFKLLPPIKVISAIRTPDKETTAGTKTNMKELISLLQDENNSEDYVEVPNINKKLTYGEIKSLISEKEETKCEYLSYDLTTNFQNAINTDSLSVKVKIDNTFKFDFKYKTVLIDKDIPDREIDILSCGTGLQSMMILSILQTFIKMKNSNDFILLIEEPEVYLHPSLQRKMINTLTSISHRNQILLTTHSPIIVSKIDKTNVHCVNKEFGETKLVNTSADTIIDELGIQTSDILNKNAVLFVEGKDDMTLFKGLINKIATNKGFGENFCEKEIDIIETNGFDKMSFYANAKVLHKDVVQTPFWIITDSDCEVVNNRKDYLMRKGISNGLKLQEKQFKILTEYAIESYFLDPQLLHNAFPGFDFERLQNLCDLYFKRYEEELSKLRKNQVMKSKFRNTFKPKIMFSNLGKPSVAIEHILKFNYEFDDENKLTREQLITQWEQREEPIAHILENMTLDFLMNTKMSEIIEILEDIVNDINNKK